MQLHIVDVATSLARQTKVQASVAMIGAVSDMMRHLRKSIHSSIDDSNLGAEMIQYNRKFQAAVDECLVQLSLKVTFDLPHLVCRSLMPNIYIFYNLVYVSSINFCINVFCNDTCTKYLVTNDKISPVTMLIVCSCFLESIKN